MEWLLITVLLIVLLTYLLLCQISNILHGTSICVFLFIEINNKRTFWPSSTGVVLFLVGQILNMVEIELKYGFP